MIQPKSRRTKKDYRVDITKPIARTDAHRALLQAARGTTKLKQDELKRVQDTIARAKDDPLLTFPCPAADLFEWAQTWDWRGKSKELNALFQDNLPRRAVPGNTPAMQGILGEFFVQLPTHDPAEVQRRDIEQQAIIKQQADQIRQQGEIIRRQDDEIESLRREVLGTIRSANGSLAWRQEKAERRAKQLEALLSEKRKAKRD